MSRSRKAPKDLVLAASTALTAAVLTVLSLEGVCRILPVRGASLTLPVSAADPVLRLKPDREFTFSQHWDFYTRRRVRVNDSGFVNDQDYAVRAPGPLAAVIGDSYIQALIIPYPETLHGRLAQRLAERARVYSFSASGAPLSQYLAYADFARREYRAAKMLFLVVGNDFDQSLLKYKSRPGFHYFEETGRGLRLRLVDYTPSPLKKLLRGSALARYVVGNLSLRAGLNSLRAKLSGEPRPLLAGSVPFSASLERIADSERAVDAFLELLPEKSGLAPRDILFVLDAVRPQLYSAEGRRASASSYFGLMKAYFKRRAEEVGYEVVDMRGPFLRAYRQQGLRMEFERDGHWNPAAHGLAFEAVVGSAWFEAIEAGSRR